MNDFVKKSLKIIGDDALFPKLMNFFQLFIRKKDMLNNFCMPLNENNSLLLLQMQKLKKKKNRFMKDYRKQIRRILQENSQSFSLVNFKIQFSNAKFKFHYKSIIRIKYKKKFLHGRF